jgi:hypothetical protein
MLPSNRPQCSAPDPRHEGRPVTPQYAIPAIGSLFNIAQSPKPAFVFFQQSVFQEKGPRGFRRRSKSGRKRPGEGQRQRGVGSHRVSYFANPRAPYIDEAQFSAHVSRATVRIATDQVGGTRTPCSRRNAPTTLIASATKRPRVSASASPSRAVILRSNTIDVPSATSAQLNVRARNGVTFRFPCFRPKIAQFAAARWPAGTSTRDRPIGRTRASAANMTPVKASTIA